MTTRTESQPYPFAPSLSELAGLIAFLAILVSGLIGLVRYGFK
jgi:hypothetical protein